MNILAFLSRYASTLLLIVVLLGLGVYKYSRLEPGQRRRIELEAALEQLYRIEQAHYAAHKRYFDPTDPQEGFGWEWLDCCQWEVGLEADAFWITAQADLDGDGQAGSWRLDSRSPQVHQLQPD